MNYKIEYELQNYLSGYHSDRIVTVEPVPADSAFDAVALLAQKIDRKFKINIISVKDYEETK